MKAVSLLSSGVTHMSLHAVPFPDLWYRVVLPDGFYLGAFSNFSDQVVLY